LFSVSLVMGAASDVAYAELVTPIHGGNYSSITLSCNSTYNSTESEYNVTFWGSDSTGVKTTTKIATVGNTSMHQYSFTYVYDISSVTPSRNYNFTCEGKNDSDSGNSTLSIYNVTLDAVNPICTLDLGHTSLPEKGVQEITWTSSDGLESIATNITIDGPDDFQTISYTDASKKLTLTSQDTKYTGDWTVTLGIYDRADNTCNITQTFKTYLPDGEGRDPTEKTKIPGILIVAVIGLVIYLITKKK